MKKQKTKYGNALKVGRPSGKEPRRPWRSAVRDQIPALRAMQEATRQKLNATCGSVISAKEHQEIVRKLQENNK